MFKYKRIKDIPYEDMTDECKRKLDGDFELLTEDNIKNLKEGMKVHYVPLDFNTKLKSFCTLKGMKLLRSAPTKPGII